MTLQPVRSFTAVQRGTRVPATFAGLASFSYAFWVRFSAPLVAGRIIRIGDPSDAGSSAVAIRVATAAEEVFTQTNCVIVLRRHRPGNADRAASPTGSAVTGAWLHLIAAFPNGAHPQLYINGISVAMTAPDTAPSGVPSITSTDELAIGDPTTSGAPGFVGDISRVTLFPFAMSATRAMITYRHQSDPLAWIGRGSKDALAATNHSPVAVPLQATANSGVPKTIDPRPVGYDQNGDTVSIVAGSATANPGSVVISAGALVYTPPTSFVGTGRLGYSLRDTAGLTSVGRVDVAVTATPPGGLPLRPYMSLPETVVSSVGNLGENLLTTYGTVTPGRIIRMPAGNYDLTSGSVFSFNRVTGLSASAPIILLPVGNNWSGVIFRKQVVVAGPHHTVAGLNMADGIAGHIIKITGDFCRVSRCSIDYTGTSAACGIVIDRANDAIVDRNAIRILNGAPAGGDGRGIGLEDAANAGLRPIIELNYLHDSIGRANDAGEVNFHEAIQTGRGVVSGSQNLGALVQYNLIDTWTNESEVVSCKSRGGMYLGNFLRNSGNSRRMSNRLGDGNIWQACKAESGGFVIRDNDQRYIGCVCTGAATFEVSAGNISAADYNDSQTGLNIVASSGAILDWCEGRVNVGLCGQTGDTNPAVNTTIRSHIGTIQSTPAGNAPGQYFFTGLTTSGTAPGTKPAIINLTSSNTGPNAA